MICKILKPAPTVFMALEYNEKKVMSGVAEIMVVRNIPSTEYHDVYTTLRERESLSLNTKKPSFHAVFNQADFDNVEYEEQMLAIIDQTMEDIGMADQPYAVYRHIDIDRKHYHVVSTKILSDGRSVLWNRIGERATRSLEIHQYESCYLAGKSMKKILQESGGESTYRNALEKFEIVLKTTTYRSRDEFAMLLSTYKISIEFQTSKYAPDSDVAILRYIDKKTRPIYVSAESVALLDEHIKANTGITHLKQLSNADLALARLYAYAAYVKNESLDTMKQFGEHIRTIEYRNKKGKTAGVSFAIANMSRIIKSSEIDVDLSKALRENDFSEGTKELFRKRYWNARLSLFPPSQLKKNESNNEGTKLEPQQDEIKIPTTTVPTPVENLQKKNKKKATKKPRQKGM